MDTSGKRLEEVKKQVNGSSREDVDCDGDSTSSSGSFHSTLESLEDARVSIIIVLTTDIHTLLLACVILLQPVRDNTLYISAMKLARNGGITCRNIR